MLKWSMTGFKGASSIEGVLDKAIAQLQQQPPAPAQDPAAAKMKEQQGKTQQALAVENAKAANKQKEIQSQTRADLVRVAAETQAGIKEQAAQFAFSTREQQRDLAVDATTQVTQLRRPQQ